MKKILVHLRRVSYLSLGAIDKLLMRTAPGVVILAYHSIANDDWKFSIDPAEFRCQIDYLEQNFRFISLADVGEYLKGKLKFDRPAVVLTFDDGYRDILTVKNFLYEKGIKPTVFILAESKKANRFQMETEKDLLKENEIIELNKLGWEIGCHSATHPNMYKLDSRKCNDEIIGAKKQLEKNLGFSIRYFSYPKGQYNRLVINTVNKAGFKLGLTMDDSLINIDSNPLLIPRVGVNRTHSFSEFKVLWSRSVILFRRFIKPINFLRMFF